MQSQPVPPRVAGRGTVRRTVEGGRLLHHACHMRLAPSPMFRMVPLPVPERN